MQSDDLGLVERLTYFHFNNVEADRATMVTIETAALRDANDLFVSAALALKTAQQQLAAKDAAMERLVAERDEARRRATDEQYMKQAYWYMLGPIGLKVAHMWFDKRVKRVHHSWGPDAASLTGEERAQCILDFEASARRVVPVDSIDGPDARQALKDAP